MKARNLLGFSRSVGFVVACLSLALGLGRSGHAQSEPFYSGKTVRIVVGSTPGGFYDRWARLLSRYIPKYIAGNPNFVVQNMPGASSVVAANYVYNLPKPDGLTVVMPINSLHLDQIVGRREVRYDVGKFEYIGSQEKTPTMMYFRADSPIKVPRRYHSSQGAAEMRLHWNREHRVYRVETFDRSIQGEDHQRDWLSGRQ
jgi:tripartite-type tricarboxylate transporter receptor subunit TctC